VKGRTYSSCMEESGRTWTSISSRQKTSVDAGMTPQRGEQLLPNVHSITGRRVQRAALAGGGQRAMARAMAGCAPWTAPHPRRHPTRQTLAAG